jgi:DNA-binding LytR/AlgR family response regulator
MHFDIKIGIVEDELIIAEKIKRLLIGMGYSACEPVSSYDDALAMIASEKPDMLLLDINLNDKKDGIDLAEQINKQHHLPFIFLTANSDSATVERAKKVKPNAFLVKPFIKEDLFTAIEIAFNNYSETKAEPIETQKRDFIFIKEGHRFIKLLFDEIIYVESRENYVVIHSKDKRSIIIRSTFSDFIKQLPTDKFIRTHRSFIVQIKVIQNVGPTEVLAHDYKIPVSNTYKPEIFIALGIKE